MRAKLIDIRDSFKRYVDESQIINGFKMDLGKDFPKNIEYPFLSVHYTELELGTGNVDRPMRIILMDKIDDNLDEISVINELEMVAENFYNFYSGGYNKSLYKDMFNISFNVNFKTKLPLDTVDNVIILYAEITVKTNSSRNVKIIPKK